MSNPFPTTIHRENADLMKDLGRRLRALGYVSDADFVDAIAGNFIDARYHHENDNVYTPPPVTSDAFETVPATIAIGETIPWFKAGRGQVFYTTAAFDGGKVSAAIGSGSGPVSISFDPTFPRDPARTSEGSGTTGYLYPAQGQRYYQKQDAADVQDMHSSMEPA